MGNAPSTAKPGAAVAEPIPRQASPQSDPSSTQLDAKTAERLTPPSHVPCSGRLSPIDISPTRSSHLSPVDRQRRYGSPVRTPPRTPETAGRVGRSSGPNTLPRNNWVSTSDFAEDTSKIPAAAFSTPTRWSSSSAKSGLAEAFALRVAQTEPHVRRRPTSRAVKKMYRKSVAKESKTIQERYRKKMEREAAARALSIKKQEKRDRLLVEGRRTWDAHVDLDVWETAKNRAQFLETHKKILGWLVRKYGVPTSYRRRVWRLAIGNGRNITPDLFLVFLQRAEEMFQAADRSEADSGAGDTTTTSGTDRGMDTHGHTQEASMFGREMSVFAIDVDLTRTFPRLAFFSAGGTYHRPLRQVLGAYCFYRPDTGYVQGMSFLAAMLLLQMEEPYETFVALVNIMGRDDGALLRFYQMEATDNEKQYRVFDDALRTRLPDVHAHLSKVGVTPDVYLLPWWMTIFSKYFSLETSTRIWDIFLFAGHSYLQQVSLGILHACRSEILKGDFGACLSVVLRRFPAYISDEDLFTSIELMAE